MRGDAGVVAPDLRQQFLARHGLGTGPVEILQDAGFLVSEAQLLALAVDENFRRRTELVLANPEDRVSGLFMTAQLRPDAGATAQS